MKRFFCKLLTYVACFFMTNYSFFSFFENSFFPFNLFLQQHKNLTKSNNKKNSYMNQLLRLPLLKYTHTHTHTHTYIYIYTYIKEKNNNNKKKDNTTLPPQEKKDSYNIPDGGPHGNGQGIGAVNCCRKDLHPRCRSYPRFSSFLCKCNLTKS